jgi:tRNA(Ile)-lysidine synthase
VSRQQAVPVEDTCERALDVILARVSVSDAPESMAIAVAYSGGLDSAALLHLVHAYARRREIKLFAFHVHHGLSPNADNWQQHCEQECERLDVRFDARRVALQEAGKDGIEQAARRSRYAALGEMCRAHHVPLLLTAHHQDDQAETVLLQLLRGSGVAGLSGMERVNTAPDLLGDPVLMVGRPLLDLSRAALEQFVNRYTIPYVEDESNADIRYARNALRHKLVPVLSEYFPGFQQRFARSAQHAQSSQRLLDELAVQDMEDCRDGEGIDLARLVQFNQDRIDNLLRHWLGTQGMRMPSTAWLDEMREQLLTAQEDAQICVTHPDGEIRRYRNRVSVTRRADQSPAVIPLSFRWIGEPWIDFPTFGGRLYVEEASEGVGVEWLRQQTLCITHRSGGEKLKLAPNRPTRTLKHHCQNLGIPPWERTKLPVVMAVDKLIFVAGVGMNWRDFPISNGPFVQLRWEKFLR